jgi:hypothetical protein
MICMSGYCIVFVFVRTVSEPCVRTSIKTRYYVTFYKLLIHLGVHHTISVCKFMHVGTGTNFRCVTRKGKWPLHLRPDTNLYVLPKHLAFEDG